MASLDFELEKQAFRYFYESNRKHLFAAKNLYLRLITSFIKRLGIDEVTKIEGRVKDKEECIKKFHRKYQNRFEADEHPYEIRFFISDLIGIRIVCLYEDQIALLSEMLQQHFKIPDITDKISSVESTEEFFGYKGLHMDLALNDKMASLPKYLPYADNSFEVQIRSLIQDAWSVLDHKIKYKKSIPIDLKRRINNSSWLYPCHASVMKARPSLTPRLKGLSPIPTAKSVCRVGWFQGWVQLRPELFWPDFSAVWAICLNPPRLPSQPPSLAQRLLSIPAKVAKYAIGGGMSEGAASLHDFTAECALGSCGIHGTQKIHLHHLLPQADRCGPTPKPCRLHDHVSIKIMKLTSCVHHFFDQYLPRIKGCSPNTIKGYRDVFSLFLPFARDTLNTSISSLQVEP